MSRDAVVYCLFSGADELVCGWVCDRFVWALPSHKYEKTCHYVMHVPVTESLEDIIDRFIQSRFDYLDYLCERIWCPVPMTYL